MIKSFKHKGLEKYFHNNAKSKINPDHAVKLAQLTGNEKGTWSVWVSGNWRVTFQFKGTDAILVDYRDYH